MSSVPSRGLATLALIAGALAIAFSPIFVRLTGTGPAAAGFWRLTLALPALAVLSLVYRTPDGTHGPRPLTLLAGLFFALDLGFWHYGVKFTTVANATILANLSPVVVVIAAWLMLGERPGKAFLAGLVLALAGAWAIAAAHGGRQGLDPSLGDAFSITTALWYAGYMICVRKLRSEQTASAVMLWSTATGVPLLLIAARLLRERIIPPTLGGWGACIGLGAVHVVGQGCIAWALRRLPAATASVVILVQPVLTAILAWLIFAETMGPLQMLGGAAALAGVVIAQLAAARGGGKEAAA
ncbi:MAG TPA: DMT family transporter [Caulobacteraceae bacterium]|nr:DMT family transporter [Caulobacteraceae bacterium]